MFKDCDIIDPDIKCSQELRAYKAEKNGNLYRNYLY